MNQITFDINAIPGIKQLTSGNLLYGTGSSAQWSMMTWRSGIGVGLEGCPRGRDIGRHIAISLRCIAETNITL